MIGALRVNEILSNQIKDIPVLHLYLRILSHQVIHSRTGSNGVCCIRSSYTNVHMCSSDVFFYFHHKNCKIKGPRPSVPRRVKCQYVVNMSITCTLMCLSIGTPKNIKFSICSKWKIHYFWVSQNLSKI